MLGRSWAKYFFLIPEKALTQDVAMPLDRKTHHLLLRKRRGRQKRDLVRRGVPHLAGHLRHDPPLLLLWLREDRDRPQGCLLHANLQKGKYLNKQVTRQQIVPLLGAEDESDLTEQDKHWTDHQLTFHGCPSKLIP